MWFKGARLLLVGVVAMILFLATESRSNLTRHPNLLRGSLVNLTRNETIALNIEDKHLYPLNEEPRKTELTQSIKKHVNSLDLKNNDVETDRSATTTSKVHRGHQKPHKHSDHQSMKTHKNKHHVHNVSLSPNLAKKHRDFVVPPGYPEPEDGDDWSCGVSLKLLCCKPILNANEIVDPSTRFPCRCRCNKMPVKADLVTGNFNDATPEQTDANNEFPYCENKHRGWATPEVTPKPSRKKSGRT